MFAEQIQNANSLLVVCRLEGASITAKNRAIALMDTVMSVTVYMLIAVRVGRNRGPLCEPDQYTMVKFP